MIAPEAGRPLAGGTARRGFCSERNNFRNIPTRRPLPFGGMILCGCCFHEKEGKRWIGWPAKPYEKQDGTKSFENIVDFVDNKAKYLLQDDVLPLVLTAMAESGR